MTIYSHRTAPARPITGAMQFLKVGLVSLGMALTGLAHADWELENSHSSLAIVSVKNAVIAEVHNFTSLNGLVDKTGAATVQIQLDSIETLIPVRNDRLRSMLFVTDDFPVATITTKLDLVPLLALVSGAALTLELPLTISLHGVSVQKSAQVRVVSLAADRYLVSAVKPLIINAGEFGLLPGIDALRTVAGLQSITPAVPVIFTLAFRATAE